MPIAAPTIIETAAARRPIARETRDPHTTSASTERPDSSVPIGYSHDGASRIGPVACVTSSSSLLTSSGASMAIRMNTIRIARPAMPITLRR
jgi:hypothetical protein